MKKNALATVLLSLAITACAQATYNHTQSYDPSLITFAQLENARNESAYDAIRRLRPGFLMSRGATSLVGSSSSYATVYVDGVRYGGLETLTQIPASWIGQVRYYRTSSVAHFGRDEIGGVLAITTRQR